jgi:oligopeptidase B
MLDDGLPLTTNEYDEWGNPARSALEYHTLLSYSPIDQVKQAHYPAIYMTTGLYDSQVQYWEPLKWLAVLRDHQLGNAPLLLESDLRAGHGGKAGRFERVPESARIVTFLLNELGCAG